MSMLQKLLGMGGTVAKRVPTNASKKLAEEIAQEAPEVIGKGTSRAAKEAAGDIPEAAFKEVTPTTGSDDLSLWNRLDKKKAAALMGLGGAGAYMMSGDETPHVPQPQLSAHEPIKPEQLKVEAKKTVPTQAPKANGLDDSALNKEVSAEESEAPVSHDFLKMINAGIAKRDQSDWEANLLRSSEKLGAGLARVAPEHSSSTARSEQGKQYTKDAETQVGALQHQQAFDKAKDEMNDETKMRDPNSDISKMTTELAQKVGILKPGQSASAMSLKNAGVNLSQLLMTIEAGNARKEAARIAGEEKATTKEASDKLKIQSSVDKQTAQLLKSKDHESYNAAKDAGHALDFALESGDKTAAGSAFMQFAKTAQGDNSVVRDNDMAVLAGGYNYLNPMDMITKLAARARGGNFNDKELKQMKEVAAAVQRIKGQRVQQLMSPILERSKSANLNLNETLDPRMVEEFSGKSSNNNSNMKQIAKKQYSPSRNQTKLIYTDGSEEVVDGKK